ncbi:type II toxin-antitoxin system RelE/ParE family toxin [Streptomyces sp. NPDC056653]|uniref:type II toxin-antitoxin system RelE/ParE family toxin n=1 Tax=Streptomyces sp. NPDC056653 TaxID=3345894 RepID=UPI0036866E2E
MRDWLEALSAKHFLKIDEYVGLLAGHAAALGEPYARYLGDGVRELRPTLDGAAIRITYWLTPNRTAVLLTAFRKTRMREDAEVRRAKLAQRSARPNTARPTRNSPAPSRKERWSNEPQPLEDPARAEARRRLHRAGRRGRGPSRDPAVPGPGESRI